MSLPEIIGVITTAALAVLICCITVGVLLLRHIRKSGRANHPRATILLVGLLCHPARTLLKRLGRSPAKIEMAGIEIMNICARDRFVRTPLEKRLLMLPHCLRHIDCPARATFAEGIRCLQCKKCGIAQIDAMCRERGIRCFIAMGSQFAMRVLREQNPDAVMGVACPIDLFRTMHEVNRRGLPMIGELLAKDGCIMTEVDWTAVSGRIFETQHPREKNEETRQ